MSGVVEGSLEAKSGDLFKKKNFFEKFHFWGPGAEFPYLGIISQYQVFLHNEPISAWECNTYIICKSWVRKSSCDSRYARKLDFSYYAQIWKFGPKPPENDFFSEIFNFYGKGTRTFWCDIYVFLIKSSLYRNTWHSARHFLRVDKLLPLFKNIVMLYCNNAE